ncbi:fungal-specific transcription factor domain-containing protein [Xylariaceae sp. FL0016]|nr:fungal-specific transcription factor domain-containing protein [Xylariaceae sp. FL0016]
MLSAQEGYLWDYFNRGITPQCVLDQNLNPYRNVVLRLAAVSPGGPLFHCILAVAANQLNSLGRKEYLPLMWSYRAEALKRLRTTIDHLCTAPNNSPKFKDEYEYDQALACAIMLCFFDVSVPQNDELKSVLNIGNRFYKTAQRAGSAEHKALQDFAVTYFVSHDILASTASRTLPEACVTADELCKGVDPEAIQTLTGCSKELLGLISEINTLGSTLDGAAASRTVVLTEGQKVCRDSIERRLHDLAMEAHTHKHSVDDEIHSIGEIKLHAARLYLYSRLDHASPNEACIATLTSTILALLPAISLRTNTVLWPLFVVATLGIHSERDDDRRMVLERLEALQSTRQLGNVKKARTIIEDVWKARDLIDANSKLGWDILIGRHQTISLA